MNPKDYIWIEVCIFIIFSCWLMNLSKGRLSDKEKLSSYGKFTSTVIILVLLVSILGYVMESNKFALQINLLIALSWTIGFYIYLSLLKRDNGKAFLRILGKYYGKGLEMVGLIFLMIALIIMSIKYFIIAQCLLTMSFIWYYSYSKKKDIEVDKKY